MTTTARAILAGGLVTLSIWDSVAQAYGGFGEELDADKFEIKPSFEDKTSESRSHRDYGQARASVVLPKPTEISIDLSAASVQALSMQFQGIVTALTQGSGNQPATDFAVTKLGVWLPLGKRNISESGLVLTDSGATEDYTLGTHFRINWLRGEIMFIPDAPNGPSKDDVIKVAMSWGAVDGKKILGGRVSQVRCQARFDGKNLVDGSPIEVDVWECVLGSGNGFDFLAPDFSPISLSGKIVTPPGKDQGYEVNLPAASG